LSKKITFLNIATEKLPTIDGPCSVWDFSSDNLALNLDLPHGWSSHDIGDLLNEIAHQIKDSFVNIDEKITTGRFFNSFLASSMGERNPYQNDFFLNLCRALSLKNISTMKDNHIILIDDISLGNALLKTCRLAAIPAEWATPTTNPIFKHFWKQCRAFGSGLCIGVKNWRLGRKLKASRKIKPIPNSVWLLNWMDEKTFSVDKALESDVLYGDIPSVIKKQVEQVTWLANPIEWLMSPSEIIENIDNSSDNVICVFEFISLKTIYRSVFGWIIFPLSIRSKLSLNGFDLSPIVAYTSRQEKTKPQIMIALLYADIAPELARKNVQPETFIYPFENQPWDKILLQSFRQFCASTRIIGMQHAPFADNYVSCIPSYNQWQKKIVPDCLVTIGREFYERLLQQSAPKNKLEIGGYYRNPRLANVTEKISNPTNKHTVILVSCPLNLRDSIELIQKSAGATSNLKKIQVLINFHPMFSQKMINETHRRVNEITDCKHIKFVDGPAQKWLEKCDIFIYNSSGTVFEAASLGIPSIYVGPDNGLDLDKTPGGSKLKCRSSEALKEIILKLTRNILLANDAVNHAQNSLRFCFSQPNPEIWAKLVSLKSTVKQS